MLTHRPLRASRRQNLDHGVEQSAARGSIEASKNPPTGSRCTIGSVVQTFNASRLCAFTAAYPSDRFAVLHGDDRV